VRTRALCAVVSAVLGTAGCTVFTDSAPEGERESAPTARVVTAAPSGRLTLIPDPDPVASAVSTSRVLFRTAEVAVLVEDGDAAGTLLGASTAVALGVPLLVVPPDAEDAADAVADELDRLGADTVLTIGTAGERSGERPGWPEVLAVPADPGAVEAVTGVDLGAAEQVAAGEDVAAVALLDPDAPAALQPAEAEAPAAPEERDLGSLPEVARGDPRPRTVLLSDGAPETLAGIATALAAGARVQLTGEGTDPRGSADVVTALSTADPESVVVLGQDLASEAGLDWKLETAASGVQLPGGGQLLFPGRLLVALYGHPGSAALGVLGEQGMEASIQRAREHAAPYGALVEYPVVPAFEIIATVASSAAGPDGNYSAEADVEDLRPWVEAAGAAGLYVVLDLQPGRTDFLTQAERYRSLLELPHVGLALDPEWRLGPNQVHLSQVGSVGIEEVNRVVAWLADLTRAKALPQKLLVLHQFKLAMLPGREHLDTSRDELAVMLHADGQGAQGAKQATWRVLHRDPPAQVFWGWKNFYDEDAPMLTPEQTVAQVDPTPALISYQ
jgi:hypothetical protein